MIQFQDCLDFKLVCVKAFCSLIMNLLVFFSGFIELVYHLKILLCDYCCIPLSLFIVTYGKCESLFFDKCEGKKVIFFV